MRTLMIFKGLPGCGKSTYAKELMKNEPKRWKRVNRDDLRSMLDNNVWSKENEKLVVALQAQIVTSALSDGFDVIIDNTHLVPATVKKLHTLAEGVGDVMVIEKAFNVSVQECHARNEKREGHARVPAKVIDDMARASGLDKGKMMQDIEVYYPSRENFAVVKQDESLPKAIMCDLDGTLAIINDRTPYDATDCDVKDKPNWPVINAVLAMYDQGVKIMFMSGRDMKYRPETERFIEKYCRVTNSHVKDHVIEYELHMRGETAPDPEKLDQRKDSVIKQELFDKYVAGKYNVLFVLDDRNQVVDFWRSIGLTCFQVAQGNF